MLTHGASMFAAVQTCALELTVAVRAIPFR